MSRQSNNQSTNQSSNQREEGSIPQWLTNSVYYCRSNVHVSLTLPRIAFNISSARLRERKENNGKNGKPRGGKGVKSDVSRLKLVMVKDAPVGRLFVGCRCVGSPSFHVLLHMTGSKVHSFFTAFCCCCCCCPSRYSIGLGAAHVYIYICLRKFFAFSVSLFFLVDYTKNLESAFSLYGCPRRHFVGPTQR